MPWQVYSSNGVPMSTGPAGGGGAGYTAGNSNLGNTAGDTGVVTGRLVLVGTNNITLSGSTNGGSMTLSISGAAAAADGLNRIVAGTQTAGTLATVVFSNSNNVSFGMSNSSVVTASATVQSTQGSFNLSAGTTSNLASAFTFNNANGVSFGLDASTITASVATSLTNIRVSAGTTSNLLSAITFSNANGVTFGLDASTITASHNGLTSQSNQALSGPNGSFTFQTAQFHNSNGVSWSTTTGSGIVASHNGITSQSNQQMTLFATGNTTQSSTGTTNASSIIFNGAGFVSVGITGGSVVISGTQTNPVVSNAIASVGSATNSGTNTSRFAADDHVHAGVFSVGVSTGGNTLGDTRVDVGRFVLAGGNNITLSQGTAAGALNTITISAANQSNQQMTMFATGNTTLSSTGTTNASSLIFRGSGLVSVGITNGSVLIDATQTNPVVSNAIASVGSATGSGTNTSRFAADDHVHAGVFSMGVSTGGNTIGDTRVDVGRFVLQGGNNITLSQITAANALNTVIVSAGAGGAGDTRMTAFATGNTTQSSTGTIPFSSYIFRGSNNASVGVSNGSVIVDVTNAPSPVNFSAGANSGNLGSVVFSNSNNMSFGLNGSTITASFNAINLGVSTGGNTAGTTGTIEGNGGQYLLVGSQGITLSQSTNGASSGTVTIVGPGPVSSYFEGHDQWQLMVGAAASVSVFPFHPRDWITATQAGFFIYQSISSSAVGNTYGQQWTVNVGVYTNDTAASRLNSISSGSTQTTFTLASNTAGATQIIGSGVRPITCPINVNMTPGLYFMAFHWSSNTFSSGTATTNLNRTVNYLARGQIVSQSNAMVSEYNVATAATRNVLWPAGILSGGATAAIPNPISHSQITMTGASLSSANLAFFLRA